MEKSQPKQTNTPVAVDSVPPVALITFIPSTKQIDVIGLHPTDPDVEITCMVSVKRRTMTKSGFESQDRTVRYSLISRTGHRTDLVIEIGERRYYGGRKQKDLNRIETTLSHLSFDADKPSLLPENRYDVRWREGNDGQVLELSQHVLVKNAYEQKTHFDVKESKTVLVAELEGGASELTIGRLMVVHRCTSSPAFWPKGKMDPRYLHAILAKHLRVKVLSLSPAESKLQAELDNISRTAHIKSCETCISDYADLELH